MLTRAEIRAIADELLRASADVTPVEPLSARVAGFDLDDAYEVLRAIGDTRRDEGWRPVGRKIGFTNRAVWPVYGVAAPMWAPVWDRTLVHADDDPVTVPLAAFQEPRIEPEVVFRTRGPVPITDDPVEVLEHVEWMAPGFEVVQSLFPNWSFGALADITAAFGAHSRLIVGRPVPVAGRERELAALLPAFEATLARDGEIVQRGGGAGVLDSPTLALVHLARVVAGQPQQAPLGAGEIITTGTLTDAPSVWPGERWTAEFGSLGLGPLTVATA